ncbi:hypothetical protein H0H92_011065 [Tricholoma furcatifolium]|nr:hypothetical protein H0H92_011065 [Tricholoma furcatifolium]
MFALGVVSVMVGVECKYDHTERVTIIRIEFVVVVTGILKVTLTASAKMVRPMSNNNVTFGIGFKIENLL